jgi:uncharacterized protein YggE
MTGPVIRHWLAAALVITLILSAGFAAAGDGEDKIPLISVSGQATMQFEPDTVELTVAAVTRAPTAEEAAAENATSMNRVSDALKKALGDKGELRTVGYRVHAVYEYDRQSKRNRFVAFEATNRVAVRSSDTKGAGALLDAAIKAGANSIDGPSWSLAKPDQAMNLVQVEAFKNARTRATVLAQAAGLQLGKVISIQVGASRQPRQPMLSYKAAPTPEATPVEAGNLNISATVSCKFALEPAKP